MVYFYLYTLFLQRLAEKQAQAIQRMSNMPTHYDLEMELQAAYSKQVGLKLDLLSPFKI